MIGPMPVAVATALISGIPCNVSSGTVNVAPPIPIKVDSRPMTNAPISSHCGLGIASANFQSSRPSAIFKASSEPKITHTQRSASLLAPLAMTMPSVTPKNIHGPMRLTMVISTAPRA